MHKFSTYTHLYARNQDKYSMGTVGPRLYDQCFLNAVVGCLRMQNVFSNRPPSQTLWVPSSQMPAASTLPIQ